MIECMLVLVYQGILHKPYDIQVYVLTEIINFSIVVRIEYDTLYLQYITIYNIIFIICSVIYNI